MAVPVLTGIFRILAVWILPWIKRFYGLLRYKAWFFVSLLTIFAGPLEWIGQGILASLSGLVPRAQALIAAIMGVDVQGLSGAMSMIGQGAGLLNCVIAVDEFMRVGIALWSVAMLSVSFTCLVWFYRMLGGNKWVGRRR